MFPPSSPHNPPILITNRVVIDLEIYRKKQSLSKKICILWLSQLGALPESKILYAVDSVIKTHQNKLKNSHRDPDAVQAFLNGLFYLCSKDISKVPDKDSTSFNSNSTCAVIKPPEKCDKCQKLEEEKRSLYEVLECVQSKKKHLENKLDLCERENLRLKERENVLKERENVLKERVKNGQVGGKKVSTLQNNLRDSKSYCIRLQNQLSAASNEIVDLKVKIVELRNKKRFVGQELSAAREDYCTLLNKTKSGSDIDVSLKRDKNAYTDDVRKAVLLLQSEAGVAAAKVARAIDIVSSNIFHHEFKESLTSTQTALNICDEGFVLSNMQSAEAILSSTNVTLHSDKTSRDQKKVVGHQLRLIRGITFF